MIPIIKHVSSTDKWHGKHLKLSYDPPQYSEVMDTFLHPGHVLTSSAHCVSLDPLPQTDTLWTECWLSETLGHKWGRISKASMSVRHHQPLWLGRGLNWFPSIHLAPEKEGINLPSSRQAFDSTINIFHKASIKSNYMFAWNFAAKC